MTETFRINNRGGHSSGGYLLEKRLQAIMGMRWNAVHAPTDSAGPALIPSLILWGVG